MKLQQVIESHNICLTDLCSFSGVKLQQLISHFNGVTTFSYFKQKTITNVVNQLTKANFKVSDLF